MHNRTVRNLTILAIVILCVVSARHPLINAVFAMFVGAWSMTKLFNSLFGPQQGFENLTVIDFFPSRELLILTLIDLLCKTTRKRTIFVFVWWSSGIFVAVVIFMTLNALLVSP